MPSQAQGLRAAWLARGSQQHGRRHSLQVPAAGNTYGNNFRVTTFGESHGGGVGCVVDGVPPRLQITQVGGVAAAGKYQGIDAAAASAGTATGAGALAGMQQ